MPDEMLTKYCKQRYIYKLEDLKVLKRLLELLNNVKNRSRPTTAYNETHSVLTYMGLWPFWSSELKPSNEYSIKQPSDFWKKELKFLPSIMISA